MSRTRKFELSFAPEVVEHLIAIERKFHLLIQTTLNEQLTYAPDHKTRNRKPLEEPAPFEAAWELRFGPGNRFRAFYDVDRIEYVVWVLAIGVKERERLFIGGKEFIS